MEDLVNKLQDLNRISSRKYSIQILSSGEFVLHERLENESSYFCCDAQELRERMYRIILKYRS